jgi:excisionase family DNA binding protein
MEHDKVGALPTNNVHDLEPLLTARELADILNVSANTVLDWAQEGRLPYFKLGRAVRFSQAEVAEWLLAQRVLTEVA